MTAADRLVCAIWTEHFIVALSFAQDEGPVMITEAEEVTDQLRTQAHSHSTGLSWL